ncbi:hypothetical protein DNJ95_04140 [Stutzerimonas kirkiae]|uniref:Uncharacterized protein n=1 Tax=Stutzerimonas kirkiae TaxID=2211392 RepID=A0A4Q9RAN5_9GAMM|nr:hypothetical protein DNJ96_07985 [Stutzerimonas kirkiae]TBV04867.1 hypothetical protein DNJ95_04140 [Stutzerimonas kirkiae]TBV12003.1 hypothetical protein DNK08_01275 [Stutzerimonas kirkiae]TBV14988.1 hypothetical protein DNK01_07790 [Stutzerimonas kirkiae]
MADFFKHLSVLSITLVTLGIGLSSNLFDKKGPAWPLLFAIPLLILASISSVLGQLSYIDVFRVPQLLTGSMYPKLARATTMPLMLFCGGSTFLGGYVLFCILGI